MRLLIKKIYNFEKICIKSQNYSHLTYKLHRMPLTNEQMIIMRIGGRNVKINKKNMNKGENLIKILSNMYHVNVRIDESLSIIEDSK